MSKTKQHVFLEEIDFLLKEIVKVQVLTYAEEFKGYQYSEFYDLIESVERFIRETNLEDFAVSTARGKRFKEFKRVWLGFLKAGWMRCIAPAIFGGDPLPKAVVLAIKETIARSSPAFYRFLESNLSVMESVFLYGLPAQIEEINEPIKKMELSGQLSVLEIMESFADLDIQTVARKKDDYFLLEGKKQSTFMGFDEQAENQAHLVLAKLAEPESNNPEYALFAAYRFTEGKAGGMIENFRYIASGKEPEIETQSPGIIVYGGDEGCRGSILSKSKVIKDKGIFVDSQIKGEILENIAFWDRAMGEIESVMNKKNQFLNSVNKNKSSILLNPYYLALTDSLLEIRSWSEGIRSLLYMEGFYQDCVNYGMADKKNYFNDLRLFYNGILMLYAEDANSLVRQSINKSFKLIKQVFGAEMAMKKTIPFNNHQGGVSRAYDFVYEKVLKNESRVFKNLLLEFEKVDAHQAVSEPLCEATAVWEDYLGGAVLHLDDLHQASGKMEPGQKKLHVKKTVQLLGDLLVCYHLIQQGLAAEEKLKEREVNFYHLKEDVKKEKSLWKWYNKLVYAEYFALNQLTKQESNLKILKRNATTVLDVFLLDGRS
ncbi:MAG: acyl-CoA/acyl-ACP dehydrogenase [Deltaproteobacteria bacterium]|nr:acyl-CoA/acyl-ACP dehydrogenase [Deltaproteobacteria bacterium]